MFLLGQDYICKNTERGWTAGHRSVHGTMKQQHPGSCNQQGCHSLGLNNYA